MNVKQVVQSIVALTLVLALMSAIFISINAQSNVSWKEYGFASTAIIAYDFDNDNVDELIVLPNYVVDNYAVIESPYVHYPYGLLIDADLDGEKELVLYNDEGHYVVYKGLQKIGEFDLGPGTPMPDLTYRAIAVGNKVLFNMTVYTFSNVASIYPVVSWGRLYAVYTCSNSICLKNAVTGRVSVVYNKSMDILGAFLTYDTLYILTKSEFGDAILIKYSLYNESSKIIGFTIPVSKVLAATYYTPGFIVVGPDGIYRLTEKAAVLIAFGSVLNYDDSYIYVYNASSINIISLRSQTTIATVILPMKKRPDIIGGRYPYIGCVYGDKTYLLILRPEPFAYIVLPYTAKVGEKVYYELRTYNAIDASLMLNGTLIPTKGYIIFNRTGVYVFTAFFSNGVVIKSVSASIRVEPRPISISFRTIDMPVAFESGRAVIEVYDALANNRVNDIPCNVTIGGERLTALPWSEFRVRFVPVSNTTMTQLKIVCGDDIRFKKTEYTVSIPLQPTVANIKIDYPSPSTLVISAIFGEMVVPGKAYIYVDNDLVAYANLPYTLSLQPGEHIITVEFMPVLTLFKPTRYVVSVKYYSNISEVPAELRTSVLVADRVEIVNRTEMQVETVTVPKPVYIEKSTPDATLTIIAGTLCGAGGFIAGMMFRKRTEKHGGGIEEEYAEYETSIETEKA